MEPIWKQCLDITVSRIKLMAFKDIRQKILWMEAIMLEARVQYKISQFNRMN